MTDQQPKTSVQELISDLNMEQVIRELEAERDPNELKLTVRLDGRYHFFLQKLADSYGDNKTNLATRLLKAALHDAIAAAGLDEMQLVMREYYGIPEGEKVSRDQVNPWLAPEVHKAHGRRQREAVQAAAAIVAKGA